jgi:hypothetical protein
MGLEPPGGTMSWNLIDSVAAMPLLARPPSASTTSTEIQRCMFDSGSLDFNGANRFLNEAVASQ